MRKPNETISQFAIRVAWETGNFWSPENPEGAGVKQTDLANLKPDDDVVVKALVSMSRMDASRYTRHVLDQRGSAPTFDGDANDPAIQAMVSEENGRCPIPDFAPPPGVSFAFDDPSIQEVVERMQRDAAMGAAAFGSGNWKGCHSVGEFHCVVAEFNTSGMGEFLRPAFVECLKRVQYGYSQRGLLWLFVENGKDLITGKPNAERVNVALSFVQSSSGWIGLAIIGQGETCTTQEIWGKFLATYRGGTTLEQIINQWTSLIAHELMHLCGFGHTNGGIGNPSIVNGLPRPWADNDPTTPRLVSGYGGVPVPIPGGDPPLPPDPPSTVEQKLRDLQVSDAVQNATLFWCVSKIKALGG